MPTSSARSLPETSGAMLALSTANASAVAVPLTGPARLAMLKASDCSVRARLSRLPELVETFDSSVSMSSLGSAELPVARTDADFTVRLIGLSEPPKVSGAPSCGAENVAVRSSAEPTAPESTAVPPATSRVSASSVVVPPAMRIVDGCASVALKSCSEASPLDSSMATPPSAICIRPAARAGMPETTAPPSKPVQTPSRLSATSMSRTMVFPAVSVAARTLPETTGVAR